MHAPTADRYPRAKRPRARAGPNILLVEDNPVNRRGRRGMLESLGCATDTRRRLDGSQAMNAANLRRGVDGLQMPGDGRIAATGE